MAIPWRPRSIEERRCKVCGARSRLISGALGVCVDCIRQRPGDALPLIRAAHERSRSAYGLSLYPPKSPNGVQCNLCANECEMGVGEKGFCGLRENIGGKLHSLVTPERGLLYSYLDPQVTNCCSGDTRILLSNGRLARIKDLVNDFLDGSGSNLACKSLNNWSLENNMIRDAQKFSSPDEMIRIVTESGLEVILTADHDVLIDGETPRYVKAEDLKPGYGIFSVKRIDVKCCAEDLYIHHHLPPSTKIYDVVFKGSLKRKVLKKFGTLRNASSASGITYSRLKAILNPSTNRYPTISEAEKLVDVSGESWSRVGGEIRVYGIKKAVQLSEVKLDRDHLYLLGLIYSDGHVKENSNGICFSNTDQDLLYAFKERYVKLFPNLRLGEFQRPLGIKRGRRKNIPTKHVVTVLEDTNPVLAWLFRNLLSPRRDKIPLNIGWLPDGHIAAFIGGLVDGDGHVSEESPRVEIPLQTKVEAEAISMLFRRLGICSSIRYDSYTSMFKVSLRSYRGVSEFHRKIKLNSARKKAALETIIKRAEDGLKDLDASERLPLFTGTVLKAVREHHNIPKSRIYRCPAVVRRYEKHTRNPLRKVLSNIIGELEENVGYDSLLSGLKKVVKSNLYVEKIRRLERVGKMDNWVYDITLKGPHNFLANGIIVKNCCSAWFCPAGTGSGYPRYAYRPGPEIGYSNLAVFFYGCNFNCLFCQNASHKELWRSEVVTLDSMIGRVRAYDGISCVCYFGGSPEPQLPFALAASRRMLEEASRVLRICFEWNGCGNPKLVREAAELALVSGGNVKFDLKCFDPNLCLALSGVPNGRAYSNFRMVAEELYGERIEMPVLTATTLLVPGYVDSEEVEAIASFISDLNPEIPYSLLVFHPSFMMDDLPITPKKQVVDCYRVAKRHLRRVHVGNLYLIGLRSTADLDG